jgi:hypothetical protein
VLRGTRAEVRIEHAARTGFRPRLVVVPAAADETVAASLARAVAAWQSDLPGITVEPVADGFEIHVPAALHTGHESHFALVLSEFVARLSHADPPPDTSARTLAKYELLARAGARARRAPASGT